MSDDTRHDGLSEVINLLAAPIAGGIRTVEQFKRGVDELFRAVDNVNRTMENLNEAASRINRLLNEVEEPVRAMMPQITRTVKAADELTALMEAPVRATAPRLERIVETLGSPGFVTLPAQVAELMQRLGPLAHGHHLVAAMAGQEDSTHHGSPCMEDNSRPLSLSSLPRVHPKRVSTDWPNKRLAVRTAADTEWVDTTMRMAGGLSRTVEAQR